jgi:hypothetical protein
MSRDSIRTSNMLSVAAAAASQRVLATKTLTDLLRSNAIWKLKLYKAPSDHFDDFSEFCEALYVNNSVTAVEVTWIFIRQLADPHRIRLMEAIGGLPELEEIAIEAPASIPALTIALSNSSTKLKSLKIRKLRL